MQETPTQAAPPEEEAGEPQRRRRYDTLFGWGISAVIHVLIILVFGGVGLFGTGEASGDGESMEVGISVETSQNEKINDQSPDQIKINPTEQKLQTEQIIQPVETQKIVNLQQQASAANGDIAVKKILSLNSTSADAQAVADTQQQWNNFAGSTGQTSNAGSSSSFFGIQARGKSFVYVIDQSGSMAGIKLEAAKLELLRSISAMKRRSKFFITFYNTKPKHMPAEGLVTANHTNKKKYFSWVNNQVQANGGTQPAESVLNAMSLRPHGIFLLSDGDFDDKLVDALKKIPRSQRIPIHTIAFFSQEGAKRLKQIAGMTGGSYKFVSKRSVQLGN